jgi:hypothetical protein
MARKKNPELHEHVPELREEADAYDGATVGVGTVHGPDKKGAAYKALTTKLAEQRLIRLRQQNAKLKLELRKLRGQVAPVDEIKRQVLAANHVVKNQLLALPDRLAMPLIHLSDPRDIRRVLRDGIVDALNDLAYEKSQS